MGLTSTFATNANSPTSSAAQNSTPLGSAAGASAASSNFNFPTWLQPGSDQATQQLQSTFDKIPQAFNVDNQVNSLNASIASQSDLSQRQASQTGAEYANRALLSGGSALGAGAVAAQAMLPTLSSNAQLKAQAAGIQSQASQSAIALASQVAGQIGTLRNNYLNNLIGYQDNSQKNYNTTLGLQEQNQQNQIAAANLTLAHPAQAANYTTGASGQVISGQQSLDAYNLTMQQQQAARSSLAAITAGH